LTGSAENCHGPNFLACRFPDWRKKEGKISGMKRLAKAVLLAAVAVVGLTGREARGAAFPSVINLYVPFAQFQGDRSVAGPDGNNRFIWDYYSTSGKFLTTLEGSVVWVLDPTGNLIGTSPVIPAVGNLISSETFSNIALHVNTDNNTTLVFAYWDPSHRYIANFGTWTLNATGSLIAYSGPVGFSGLQITDLELKQGYLVATFAPVGESFSAGTLTGPFTVWVMDEFGHLVSAVGGQTLGGGLLGSVTLSGPKDSPNQLWHWFGAVLSPLRFEIAAEEFNSSGTAIAGYNYGPY
jgi:hypothetical protein